MPTEARSAVLTSSRKWGTTALGVLSGHIHWNILPRSDRLWSRCPHPARRITVLQVRFQRTTVGRRTTTGPRRRRLQRRGIVDTVETHPNAALALSRKVCSTPPGCPKLGVASKTLGTTHQVLSCSQLGESQVRGIPHPTQKGLGRENPVTTLGHHLPPANNAAPGRSATVLWRGASRGHRRLSRPKGR